MKRTIGAALLLVGLPFVANAQVTCQKIGSQVFCNSASGQSMNETQIGNSQFYSYGNPGAAQQQGLPTSSTRIGNTRFYDNGVTQQHIGNTDFYSNGVTRQRIGNTDFYSNGTTCQTIGGTRFCN